MKQLLLLICFSIFSVAIYAQTYPHVTIRDIQYQNPDSLNIYFDDDHAPSLNNDTVIVTGVVMQSPYKAGSDSVIMYVGGGSAGFFLQDTTQGMTDWSGILALHENDVYGEAFSQLDSGYIVNLTGIVYEYATTTQKTTEFKVINFDAGNVVGIMDRPQAEVLTMDSVKNGDDTPKAISEKWEGVYVEFRNVTTFNRNTSGGFYIQDENGLTLNIGTKSDYFYGYNAPNDGTVLNYIRGYLETRSTGSGGITLNPGYRDDFEVAAFPPAITNVLRNPVIVNYGQSVNITADISDQDGTVDTVKLIWRKNGGAYNFTNMTLGTPPSYSAIIPAQSDSSFIDFFIWAKDNDGNVATNPSDTSRSRYTYFVLDPNEDLTIQHVQYSPFGSGYSSYNGYQVTVTGVVTADTTDIEGNETGTQSFPQVYIQNGQGPWSGIHINGTEVLNLSRGDKVKVIGIVGESNSVTQISGLDNSSNVVLVSTGNPLPDAEPVSTSTIDLSGNGVVQAERWEGVLVKYQNINVTDENADGNPGPDEGTGGNRNYGDIMVADSSGSNARIDLEDGTHSYHNFWFPGQDTIPIYVKQNSTFQSVSGILWYAFGNYKLIPRKNDDFVGFVSDVKEVPSNQPLSFKLNQNYPNPFNPTTKISYSVDQAGLVTLKIYNVLGQEVKTLVNNYQNSGSYKVNFNATSLPSGVYLYRLTSGNLVQVKKMVLLK
jgi:Secretion system C-terminal sorting domain